MNVFKYTFYDSESRSNKSIVLKAGDIVKEFDGTEKIVTEEMITMLNKMSEEEKKSDYHYYEIIDKRFLFYEKIAHDGSYDGYYIEDFEKIKGGEDPCDILYGDEDDAGDNDEMIAKLGEFMKSITEEERLLFYNHIVENKRLEELRREYVAKTGKQITQQAYSKRWNKILDKACKFFGVERVRKRKRKEHKNE